MLDKQSKYTKLLIGIIMDLIGCVSYFFPVIGEAFDFFWAPFSAYILTRLYRGTVGKVGGIVNFIEEISPGLDLIPTFTLTWIYTYYLRRTAKGDILH